MTLRKADGVYQDRRPTLVYPLWGMLVYGGLCVATAAGISLLLQSNLAAVAELHPDLIEVQSRGVSTLLGGLFGGGYAAFGILIHRLHGRKVLDP